MAVVGRVLKCPSSKEQHLFLRVIQCIFSVKNEDIGVFISHVCH